jgi:hypothetical protein
MSSRDKPIELIVPDLRIRVKFRASSKTQYILRLNTKGRPSSRLSRTLHLAAIEFAGIVDARGCQYRVADGEIDVGI